MSWPIIEWAVNWIYQDLSQNKCALSLFSRLWVSSWSRLLRRTPASVSQADLGHPVKFQINCEWCLGTRYIAYTAQNILKAENKIRNNFTHLKFKSECPMFSFAKSGTSIPEWRHPGKFQAAWGSKLCSRGVAMAAWARLPRPGEHPLFKGAAPRHPWTLDC